MNSFKLSDNKGNSWIYTLPESNGSSYTLGRSRDCNISLPEFPELSRLHCRITYWNGLLMVRDCNSSNGTLLDGKRITEEVLLPGRVFTIGSCSITAVDTPVEEEQPPYQEQQPAWGGETAEEPPYEEPYPQLDANPYTSAGMMPEPTPYAEPPYPQPFTPQEDYQPPFAPHPDFEQPYMPHPGFQQPYPKHFEADTGSAHEPAPQPAPAPAPAPVPEQKPKAAPAPQKKKLVTKQTKARAFKKTCMPKPEKPAHLPDVQLPPPLNEGSGKHKPLNVRRLVETMQEKPGERAARKAARTIPVVKGEKVAPRALARTKERTAESGVLLGLPADFECSLALHTTAKELKEGTNLQFTFHSAVNCFLYLIQYDAEGNAVVLVGATGAEKNNAIPAGAERTFPPLQDGCYDFVVEPPFGSDTIVAIACSEANNFETELTTLMAQQRVQGPLTPGRAEIAAICRVNSMGTQWASAILQLDTVPATPPLPDEAPEA